MPKFTMTVKLCLKRGLKLTATRNPTPKCQQIESTWTNAGETRKSAATNRRYTKELLSLSGATPVRAHSRFLGTIKGSFWDDSAR